MNTETLGKDTGYTFTIHDTYWWGKTSRWLSAGYIDAAALMNPNESEVKTYPLRN